MFGKKIDRKSLKACIKNKHLLKKVSADKIKEELFKIMTAPYAVRALELVFDNAILDFLIAPPKNLNAMQKLDDLVKNLNIEKSIIRRILVIFQPDTKRANRLADIFRLNKEEKEYLLTLCSSKLTISNFKDSVSINKSLYRYGKELCRDMWICLNLENPDFYLIKSTLNTLDSTNIPTFPVTGKDLIKSGAETKLIGLYLDILKKEWFEKGCSLSKSDLLKIYSEQF